MDMSGSRTPARFHYIVDSLPSVPTLELIVLPRSRHSCGGTGTLLTLVSLPEVGMYDRPVYSPPGASASSS